MGELKLKISDGVERKSRIYALKKYGYKKGALSMAVDKILSEPIKKNKGRKTCFSSPWGAGKIWIPLH